MFNIGLIYLNVHKFAECHLSDYFPDHFQTIIEVEARDVACPYREMVDLVSHCFTAPQSLYESVRSTQWGAWLEVKLDMRFEKMLGDGIPRLADQGRWEDGCAVAGVNLRASNVQTLPCPERGASTNLFEH